MSNLDKLNKIFVNVFGVDEGILNDGFGKNNVSEWDSVHQLSIIAEMEETFDIMLDPEDISACESYGACKEILLKNGVEL